jgi:hypothetical protein
MNRILEPKIKFRVEKIINKRNKKLKVLFFHLNELKPKYIKAKSTKRVV